MAVTRRYTSIAIIYTYVRTHCKDSWSELHITLTFIQHVISYLNIIIFVITWEAYYRKRVCYIRKY